MSERPISLHHAGPGRWGWGAAGAGGGLASAAGGHGAGVLHRRAHACAGAWPSPPAASTWCWALAGWCRLGTRPSWAWGPTVAIAADAGLTSASFAWPLAIGVSSLAAALVGAISLRTRGVYFIMITLAFAQMFYFLAVSLRAYGGDDGLPLAARSTLGWGLDLKDDNHLYAVALALLVAVLAKAARAIEQPFGWLLQGSRENETRMAALGSPVARVQWGFRDRRGHCRVGWRLAGQSQWPRYAAHAALEPVGAAVGDGHPSAARARSGVG